MYAYSDFKHIDIFSNIDLQFAGFMARLSTVEDPSVALAAALVSSRTRSGDVCLDLQGVAGTSIGDKNSQEGPIFICPPLQSWRDILLKSGVVGEPGMYRPLILDARSRLYLQRYWQYEQKLADFLVERAGRQLTDLDSMSARDSLERLFPATPQIETDWQKIAAVAAALKTLCVISGGPGTGKTFAVTRILAFLVEQNQGKDLKIQLAAPTGKAAARLVESISQSKLDLACEPDIKSAIPEQSYTIHRMLKSTRETSRFFYNAENRLPADVVVVDEASMVDLPLMSKLVQALSDNARLLLLGDKDQLSSVEAGSVLGDICGRGLINRYSDEFRQKIEHVSGQDVMKTGKIEARSGLPDSTVTFSSNYRFNKKSGILRLSRLINSGRTAEAVDLLKSGMTADVKWSFFSGKKELHAHIKDGVERYFVKLSRERDPARALELLGQFRILCALNHGAHGVRALNARVIQMLVSARAIKQKAGDSTWYHGRPILIRKNDYRLGLFNGDTGVAMNTASGDTGGVSVFFKDSRGEIRQVEPYRLQDHETAYAMTVHKSQGSEFDDVLLILPQKDTPVLTRELVYTGITRARQNLSLLCTESAISTAVSRRIERTSGLRDKLAGIEVER